MAFRVQMNWQQQSGRLGGWGESFWSSEAEASVVKVNADALNTLADAAKGIQVIPTSIRISDIAISRSAQNIPIVVSPGTVTDSNDADYPSTALQLKFSGAGGYTTTQWFRGIPDTIIRNSGRYVPTPGYLKVIKPFLAALTNSANNWSMRCLNKGTAKKVVTNLTLDTGVITCPAHGYGPVGTVVTTRISGFSSPSGVNKVWRATVLTADTLQLSFWQAITGVNVKGNNPTSRLQVYVLIQINKAEVVRATSHYTGRPTGLLGGRRRKRKNQTA